MTGSEEVLRTFGDAYIPLYRKSFDRLEIDVQLWDETIARFVAEDAQSIEDLGTWECEALLRLPTASGTLPRFAIVDTDHNTTLSFTAGRISYMKPDGATELLFPT